MKRIMMTRFLTTFLLLVAIMAITSPARAGLKAVGPIDVVTTVPSYYQDTSGLALQPCLDQNGFCVLTPLFDPAVTFPPKPITTTGPINDQNFPDESFYFLADSIITTPAGVKFVYRAAMETAFLAGVTPNTGITFLRINFKKTSGLRPNSTYTVTHPYGKFDMTTDAAGNTNLGLAGQAFRTEDPLAAAPGVYFPPELQNAITTQIGPFLTRALGVIVDPLTGNTYVGDAATPVTVTGSPFGTNFLRVDGPDAGGPGVNTVETPLFTLAGRVYTGPIASPMNLNRTTYARTASSGQVDLFVTALPTASVAVSGAGVPATPMVQDQPNSGKFFLHLPLPTSVLPPLDITNSLDTPVILHPVDLVDEVRISQATYDPAANTMTIRAESLDKVAPLTTLRAPQLPAPNTLDASGVLVKTLTSIPPQNIEVISSLGGSASVPVSMVTAKVPPVAANDTTNTTINRAATINVIGNDTATLPATIDPASVEIVTFPGSGTVKPDSNGNVTYTPAVDFTGNETFTYTVKDSNGTTSNTATVAVTVAAPTPATGVTANAAPAATQVINNLVTITAAATGGTGSYEYRFYVNDGGTFYLIQPYSAANSCVWLPGKPGVYDFFVEARSAGSTTLRDTFTNVFAYVVTSPAATGVTLNPSVASPQAAGTPVIFTAQASGGTGSYEYRFWLNSGAGYSIVRSYSTTNTWTFNPSQAGNYDIFVEARIVGTSSNRDAFNSILGYQIQ